MQTARSTPTRSTATTDATSGGLGSGNKGESVGSASYGEVMTSSSRLQVLLTQALDQFDAAGTTVAANVRRASRIASLRKDYVNQLWLQWEMTDLSAGKSQRWQDPAIARIKAELDTLLGAEAGTNESFRAFLQFERNRTMDVDGQAMVNGNSIGQLEDQLRAAQNAYDEFAIPAGLSSGDAYYAQRNVDAGKAVLIPTINTMQTMVDRVRSSVYSFLVATEAELEQGQPQAGVFVRAQEYVNGALAQYAPKALEQFVAAQDRLYGGAREDLAHALTSCRRMLKSLADHLYPATNKAVSGIDGIQRTMSDDQYRNRLLEYVRQVLGKHGQSAVIQKTLDSLGARLKSLDSLASKGVHDDVTAAEAETCVVWTYLLAADLIRLADGTSALLVSDAAA